jgi:regulator of cell morphogenesis and NO signaling
MSITPQTTISEIARTRPATTRVFERRGIDYCCGGGRSLADACARAGLDVAALVAELEVAPTTAADRDWASAPIGALIDHLVSTHHAFTRSELERLTQLAAKVARVHGDKQPMLVALDREVQQMALELGAHLAKEEQILFPRIRAGAPVDGPVAVMMEEHDTHGQTLARLAEMTGGYAPPAEACGSWRALYDSLASLDADLHRHIHLENNILFPRADAAA